MKARSLIAVLSLLLPVTLAARAAAELDAAAVFNGRCAACHTVGRGDDVGPDLKGVADRHEEAWLVRFIQSSQSLVAAGDPQAVELFERYGRQKMPDHPYTADEIGQILAYIAAGGPAATPRMRAAADATWAEIGAGRDLFLNRAAGAAVCASCHTVSASETAAGVHLGGSLVHAFSKYQDVELERALGYSTGLCQRSLDTEKSFLMRAYLRHVDTNGGEEVAAAATYLPLLGFGVAGAFLAAGRFVGGMGRRRIRLRFTASAGEAP